MLNSNELQIRIRSALLRLSIEAVPGGHAWGSGFFISPVGHVLTAYHNLPTTVQSSRRGGMEATLLDGSTVWLDYVPMEGDEQRDIALLKAETSQGPQDKYILF